MLRKKISCNTELYIRVTQKDTFLVEVSNKTGIILRFGRTCWGGGYQLFPPG